MWKHAKGKSGDPVFAPMIVRRVAHTTEEGIVLSMSDGKSWMPDELKENGWSRVRK
jgi:hypothetical protein